MLSNILRSITQLGCCHRVVPFLLECTGTTYAALSRLSVRCDTAAVAGSAVTDWFVAGFHYIYMIQQYPVCLVVFLPGDTAVAPAPN